MSNLSPLTAGFNELDITAEERESLFSNLVIPSKQYSMSVLTNEGTRVYKRINPEVFVLKVLEQNQELINQLAGTRNFYKNVANQFTETEAMLILNNGVIVRGSSFIDIYNKTKANAFAYIKCLENGLEVIKTIPVSTVVLVNTALTADELANIKPIEYNSIMSIEPALLDDVLRTRKVLIEQTAAQETINQPLNS